MPAINYVYEDERFRRWHIACAHTGLKFKEWVGKALDEAAERQETEEERRRPRR